MNQKIEQENLELQRGLILVEALLEEAITSQRAQWKKHSEGKKPGEWWITDQEADLLLAEQKEITAKPATTSIQKKRDDFFQSLSQDTANHTYPPLYQLATSLQLSQQEVEVLLILIAPHLDVKFEKLYAYLQDNANCRYPTQSLLNLLYGDRLQAQIGLQRILSKSSKLHYWQLIEVDTSQGFGGLQPIFLDPFIKDYLLGATVFDPKLTHYLQLQQVQESEPLYLDAETLDKIQGIVTYLASEAALKHQYSIQFTGDNHSEKAKVAGTLAQAFGVPLFNLSLHQLLGDKEEKNLTLLIQRQIALVQAALAVDSIDLVQMNNPQEFSLKQETLKNLQDASPLFFVHGSEPWPQKQGDIARVNLEISVQLPSADLRKLLWQAALVEYPKEVQALSQQISNQYKFDANQIFRASKAAFGAALHRNPEQPIPNLQDLASGCIQQCNIGLTSLARKITTNSVWEDLILPTDEKEQLLGICDQHRYQSQVYENWGFNQKLSYGRGMHILFAGPSGTGKTMSAGIIAKELNLAIYQINLSSIVSKYIGETEKNLSKIFQEATSSNAILFFDEADALFGKRSDVQSSNDRHANIETGYLLQQMEEYEGVTILASNLKENMDEAFLRRMQFIINFPFPEPSTRKRLWEGVFPKDAPLDLDVNFGFLADKIKLAGGNIKNIALTASFRAAKEHKSISLLHILMGAKQEYLKIGKTFIPSDFAPYFDEPNTGESHANLC